MSSEAKSHIANTPSEQLTDVARPAGKAHEFAAQRDWAGYYAAVAGKPARDTLLKALALFDAESKPDAPKPVGRLSVPPVTGRRAVDLGCGTGRDTLELLRRGWSVVAQDHTPGAFALMWPSVPEEYRARLTTSTAGYAEFEIPEAELINASYALPFCAPERFEEVWSRVVRALPRGGRFAGQFFGDQDDWAVMADRTHHTRPQVERLLKDFVIEQLNEIQNYEAGVTGTLKNWHIFHVVARKVR